jgi:hypothetical protein
MPILQPALEAAGSIGSRAGGSAALKAHRADAAEAAETLGGLQAGGRGGEDPDWLEVSGALELEADPEPVDPLARDPEVAVRTRPEADREAMEADAEAWVWSAMTTPSPMNMLAAAAMIQRRMACARLRRANKAGESETVMVTSFRSGLGTSTTIGVPCQRAVRLR